MILTDTYNIEVRIKEFVVEIDKHMKNVKEVLNSYNQIGYASSECRCSFEIISTLSRICADIIYEKQKDEERKENQRSEIF